RDPDTGQQAQNNFLGNNSGITWRDDGQDNLYRAQASYKYSTTAHHWLTVDDKEVEARTVERRYNRFHLLESEITRQAGHVQVSETTYHGKVTEAFDNQPNNFQLPRTSTQTWRLDQDAARRRSETVETHYDLHGNLIEEIQPTGVRTVIEYYPAQGDQGCPPDPEGFVRNLKSETVHPAPGGDAPAPVLRTSYRYQALAALAGGAGGFATSASTWLLPCQQTLCEVIDTVERPALQATSFQAIDNVGDVLRHGRALSQTLSMGGQDTTTEYAYRKEVRDGHPVLITEQTLTGFDHGRPGEDGLPRHACKKITLEHSILIGEPLLNRDDNDVEIAYEYDALRRVVRETVAPNDDVYRASREYAYYLVSDAGQQAWQSMTDVKGVITRSLVDGLNRTVSELRHDADAQNSVLREEFRLRYQAAYDGLGQLIEEVQHDWLGNEQIPLRTRYEYDEWGQQCCETGPDLVKHFQHNDPIGTAESGHLPIQTVWSESADGKKRLGKTVTWINPFQQPVQMQRFDLAEKAVSKHEYFYDGLGRTVREIDGRRAVTRHAYDAFDRLVDQTLPDNTVVHRDYAVHSSQDLPTRIQTQERQNIIVLGEQAFDGIDRMVSSTTGGRKRVMFYDPGQRQPRKVMTATGQEIEYQYLPQLSEAPLQRGIPGKQANYVYDAKNARLTSSKEQHQEISRDYFSTGELRLETRRIGEESWNMQYDYSLQGRILSYVDVLGQEQSYTYDQAGRLENTTLGSTRSDFSYDALGSLERIETQDGEQKLTTELEYDELGRETLRRFIHSDTTQELAQTYNAIDQLTRKTLTEQGKLLRDETYDYDLRGRLVSYTCDGPLAPVDPYGKTIREQQFDFDRLDNIVWVFTAFDGADGKLEDNEATYLFENEDPAQLSGIENTHPDYPAKIELLYDGDGNLVQDEQGRTLSYDALGRLMSVELSDGGGARYDYDPLDRLASQES
ncbi:RHS repeat protein, partial [Pseudomonas fulva]